MNNIKNKLNQNMSLPNGENTAGTLKPGNIPLKFWDNEKGEVRYDDVLKSYTELEKKINNFTAKGQDGMNVLDLALKTEDSNESYDIIINNSMLEIDDEINKRLKDAKLTNAQAQLVYDIGGEVISEIVRTLSTKFKSVRELEKLESHFGGEERFDEISRQLLLWGEKNMPADLFESLACSYYGVLALYNMMMTSEPGLMNFGHEGEEGLSDKKLKSMMEDPRYWRDGDKDYIKKIDNGFKALYDNK